MTDEADREQLDLFAEEQALTSVPLQSPEELERRRELMRLGPDERMQGLLNVRQLRERLAAGDQVPYVPSRPCRWCGSIEATLGESGNQLPVRCVSCGRVSYNAPKDEVGFANRSVKTLRADVSPSQQARILDRDHGRCVLCGTSDYLTIGHLLSVADGLRVGAAPEVLNDDVNLAAMCEGCNSGLGEQSVSLLTARLFHHLLEAQRARSPVIGRYHPRVVR